MSSEAQPLHELGETGWFAALVDEAVARAQFPVAGSDFPTPRRLSDLDGELRERLWSSAVLLGRAFDAREPVLARTEPERAFLQLLRFELACAADLAVTLVPDTDPAVLRLQLGAIFAAHAGELATAIVLDETARNTRGLRERDEKRLFGIVGARLHRRAYLAGNPPAGLPLHALLAAIDARALLRLTAAVLMRRGPLSTRAPRAGARQSALRALAIELFASLLAPADDSETSRTIARQVRSAALTTPDRRLLLRAIVSPTEASTLLLQVPPRLRPMLVEQLVLGALLARRWTPEARRRVEALAQSASMRMSELSALETRAAAYLVEHEKEAAALAAGNPELVRELLGSTSDMLGAAAEAIALEARETGELGVLLARLAQGEELTPEERRAMREQLVDLAKVVPSLALFAAPGGMILLPIVLKLLPFDLRPSAFRGQQRAASTPPPAKIEPPEAA